MVTAASLGFGYWSLVMGAAVAKATCGASLCWKPIPFAIPRWQEIRAPIELAGRLPLAVWPGLATRRPTASWSAAYWATPRSESAGWR